MRTILVLAALVGGCGSADVSSDMAASPSVDMAKLSSDSDGGLEGTDLASVDLAPQPDLAWTDLAGGVDIAEAPDLTQPPADMASGPLDLLGCTTDERIGLACTANFQCCGGGICSYSGANPGSLSCCRAKNVSCTKDSDCCGSAGNPAGLGCGTDKRCK